MSDTETTSLLQYPDSIGVLIVVVPIMALVMIIICYIERVLRDIQAETMDIPRARVRDSDDLEETSRPSSYKYKSFTRGYKAVTLKGGSKRGSCVFRKDTWVRDCDPCDPDPTICGPGLYFCLTLSDVRHWANALGYTHYVEVMVPAGYVLSMDRKARSRELYIVTDPQPLYGPTVDTLIREFKTKIGDMWQEYDDNDLVKTLINTGLEVLIGKDQLVEYLQVLRHDTYNDLRARIGHKFPDVFKTTDNMILDPDLVNWPTMRNIYANMPVTVMAPITARMIETQHKKCQLIGLRHIEHYLNSAHSRSNFKKLVGKVNRVGLNIPRYMTREWAKKRWYAH